MTQDPHAGCKAGAGDLFPLSRVACGPGEEYWWSVMAQLSLNKFSENLPVSGTIGLTQAAAGLGLGLLIADKMSGESRRRTGSLLLVAGALALAPVVASVVTRVRNRPTSSSRARRQLQSIREDVGFHDSEHLI